MRLHVAPSRKFKTATVKIFLRCDLEPRAATEISALRFVLRHGTEAHPSLRDVVRVMESLYGGGMEMNISKLGEQQVLVLGLEVLGERFVPPGSGLLKQALSLLCDILLRPARDERGHLRAEKVEQETEQLRRAIEGLINDKGSYAAERCIQELCPNEPYGVYEWGALEDLPTLTGETLEARRRLIVDRAPIDIYAVGAVEATRLIEVLGDVLHLEREGEQPLRGTTPHPPRRAKVHAASDRVEGLSQSRLILAHRVDIRLGDPDYWALLLMNGVLGGFPHSKLFRNVREEAGLCYDASSSIDRFKGLLFMSAGIDAANREQTEAMCTAQLDAIRRGEIDDDELESTRRSFAQAYQGLLDSPSYLVNVEYMMSQAGLPGAPREAVARMAEVTREQLQAAAHKVRLDTAYFLGPQDG